MQFRQQNDLLIHDYVIMPDHLHLLFTLHGELKADAAVRRLQKAFAESLEREFRYSGEVWRKGFEPKEVQSADECRAVMQKIHSNPVRKGFCDDPRAYRLSSTSSRWVLDPLPDSLRALLPA
jgi:putative transposase